MFNSLYKIINNLRDENTFLKKKLVEKQEEISKLCAELLTVREQERCIKGSYKIQQDLIELLRKHEMSQKHE